jgi:hypothetical protein
MDNTRIHTIWGALPMIRKAVTAAIVRLEIQCVMSKAHRFDVPNGRKKFSFFISLQDRTANST